MSGNKDSSNITFIYIVNKIEGNGIQYFRECILKTNQFSTRHILQQILQDYSAHVEKIKTIIGALENVVISEKHIKPLLNRSIFDKLNDKYDLENLNFIEATDLAIKLIDHTIGLYNKLASLSTNQEIRRICQLILSEKNGYLENLNKERERLRYK